MPNINLTTSTIKEAAQIFSDWASLEGLLIRYQQPTKSLQELAPFIYHIMDEGKSKLRARGINYIGFNESDNTITAYLKKVAPNSKKFLENLPENVCGYPIKYKQGNIEQIGVSSTSPHSSPWTIYRSSSGKEHYSCGSSISVGNYHDAGTLGCLVRDSEGNLFGLSNNHVVGSCNHAPVGLPILAPGVADVSAYGRDPFSIGHLYKTLPMKPGGVMMESSV